MRFCSILALTLLATEISAFIVYTSQSARPKGVHDMVQVPLIPEPEGGEELVAMSTMEGTRMKKMDEAKGVASEDGSTVHNFWLNTVANGELIKEYKITMLKESKKKANFPGFRKGQIPPYAMPQIQAFSIQEGIIKTIEQAVVAYGLKALSGSDGEVEVLEDVKEMCKGYKDGDNLEFTATFKATFDSSKVPADKIVSETDVLDVEVASIEEDAVEVEANVLDE